MTIYDQLRTEFKNCSDAHRDYRFAIARFANQFVEGFREYLGAPKTYQDSDGNHLPYFELCKVIGAPSGARFNLEPANMYEALGDTEDGNLTFGMRIVLESAQNAFPKHHFGFSAILHPEENACQLDIAGATFSLVLSDAKKDSQPVYDYLLRQIKDWLSAKPWDTDAKTNKIGFVHL